MAALTVLICLPGGAFLPARRLVRGHAPRGCQGLLTRTFWRGRAASEFGRDHVERAGLNLVVEW
eukprot:1400667-Rhodomonas_salina.1